MTKLFLLQSGFVTPNATYLVKEDSHDLSLRDKLYLSDSRITDNTSYYDENIEKLFNLWRQNNEHIRKFEFRQEILEAAFRVFRFKSNSILPWLRIQLTQRTVGYLHRKYLKETFGFAMLRQMREMENYTFYRLLNPAGDNDSFQTGKEDPDAVLKEFIHSGESIEISDVIASWSKDVVGIIDLLVTLHVVFGRREGSSSVKMVA